MWIPSLLDDCFVLFIFTSCAFLCTVSKADITSCVSYCGNSTGLDCPSGYSCTQWRGCNWECLRTGKYQPDDCPMANCQAINCPLGFVRYENGCEGCTCAQEYLVKALGSGCSSRVKTDGACVEFCGSKTGLGCPSGYSCQLVGACNKECRRTDQYQQPSNCPMFKCMDVSCPLGYVRDENGCEGCGCAREKLVEAIECLASSGSGSGLGLSVWLVAAFVFHLWATTR